MIIFVLFYYIFLISFCDSQSRVVHLQQGPVRGYKDVDYGIYAFYGIPYAKAPTGINRFKGPLPPVEWNETFEAIDTETVCPQTNLTNMLPESKITKEDCLITNIYIPATEETNLQVVVYVHGGGFLFGWGNMFTPKKLVQSEKVIAITFNYRLSAHGFLCLGTKNIPGNAGMKDQVALLLWVKNNIVKFGGNPNNVILTGFSSGATAVDILMLSKMTKGLFKKVIPDSGANIAPFSVQLDPIENAKMYAKLLKFNNVDDIQMLEHFFMTIPYEILNSGQVHQRIDSTTIMVPCVERDLGEERFLEDSPVNILKSGRYEKVPMLYGFTDMDGLYRLPQFENWMPQMNKNFSEFLPADLQFKNINEKEEIAKMIRNFYFDENLTVEGKVLKYIEYFTDVMFALPILRSVKFQVEAGNDQIYLYEYSYVEDSAPFIPHTNVRGANHCAQTFAIMDGYWNDTIVEEKDVSEDIVKRKIFMKQFWSSFMISGNPIPEGSNFPAWPPVGKNVLPYMSINRTLELKESPLKERSLFWEEIYNKHYRYPIAPTLSTRL